MELVGGRIRITYNTGTLEGIKSESLGENLNDGQFHHVQVDSRPPTANITLDKNACKSSLSSGCDVSVQSHQTFTSLNLIYPLYFGGVDPEMADFDPYLHSSEGITGCIKNVYVNTQIQDLLGDNNSSLPVPGCRTLSPCDSLPCLNGATCRDLWDSFTCSCSVGFDDTKNCQLQTSANFLPNQSLYFSSPTLSTMSFEFIPVVNEGVLFYVANVRHQLYSTV